MKNKAFKPFIVLAMIGSFLLVLVGCFGGDKAADSLLPGGAAPAPDLNLGEIAVSGVAALGPINAGHVEVYLLDASGAESVQVGEGETDATGNFTVNISLPPGVAADSAPLSIKVSGGSFVDEATGSVVQRTSADVIRNWVASAETTDVADVGVTLITEMAAQNAYSQVAIDNVGPNDIRSKINSAHRFFSEAFGTDISKAPENIYDNNFDITSAPGQMASVLAGLAVMADKLNVKQEDLAGIFARDALDGTLDGKLHAEQIVLTHGTVAVAFADATKTPMDLVTDNMRTFFNSPQAPASTDLTDIHLTFVEAPTDPLIIHIDETDTEYTDWLATEKETHDDLSFDDSFTGSTADDAGTFYDTTDTTATHLYPAGCDPVNYDEILCASTLDQSAPGTEAAVIRIYIDGTVDSFNLDFGYVAAGTVATRTITLKNLGGVSASQLHGIFSSSTGSTTSGSGFGYSGGVFPGLNGTCTPLLEAGAECLVEVEYYPDSSLVDPNNSYPSGYGLLMFSYYDGAGTGSSISEINLTALSQ